MNGTDSSLPRPTTARDLVDAYDGLLLDAYGVLVTWSGALPGADRFLQHARAQSVPFLVVTNDASREPTRAAAWYRSLGLDVRDDEVVSSGSLLRSWFDDNGCRGARTVVLGTDDSRAMAVEGGGDLVEAHEDFEVLALCDERGYDFIDTIDHVLSRVLVRAARGDDTRVLVCNPDVLYPKGDDAVGLAAGGIAAMLEHALTHRLGARAPTFERLGKPHAPIFDAALRTLDVGRPLMVGDQLATDVRGARAAGIDVALVLGLLTSEADARAAAEPPDWILYDVDVPEADGPEADVPEG